MGFKKSAQLQIKLITGKANVFYKLNLHVKTKQKKGKIKQWKSKQRVILRMPLSQLIFLPQAINFPL